MAQWCMARVENHRPLLDYYHHPGCTDHHYAENQITNHTETALNQKSAPRRKESVSKQFRKNSMQRNMRLVVLGAAESGVGAAILALQKGYEVFVSDMGSIKPRYQEMLRKHHIAFEEGKQKLKKAAEEFMKEHNIDPATAGETGETCPNCGKKIWNPHKYGFNLPGYPDDYENSGYCTGTCGIQLS